MTLLSIIVPVSRLAGELENLKIWLGKAVSLGVETIIVHDVQDEVTSIELQDIQTGIEGGSLTVVEGKFGSPGAARNVGLQISTGQWVMFWDGDDVGEIESVLDELTLHATNSIDAIVFQFDTRTIALSKNFYKVSQNAKTEDSIAVATNPGLWRMCFRGDLVRNFKFPELSMAEDQMFLTAINFYDLRILYSNRLAYHYYRGRSGQLTQNPNAIKDLVLTISELKTQMLLEANFFLAILLFRQSLTAMKRGKSKTKLVGLRSMFWIFLRYPKMAIYSAYQVKVRK